MASPTDQVSSEMRDTLLIQFREICAVDEISVASLYLQRFQWNLEEAVQNYLAEKDGEMSSNTRANGYSSAGDLPIQQVNSLIRRNSGPYASNSASSTVYSSLRHQTNHEFRRPRMGWIEWTWNLVTLPAKFFFVTLFDVWRFFYRSFFNFDRAVTNPAEDIDKFIGDFENKYGSDHPTFYRGSYSQVLNDAKKELKYLCVYLHCETHRDTDKFCRLTVNNREVKEFLNTRTLFWACSVKLREGYRVSQAMHETTYPFVAIICLREGRMMVVTRQEGYLDAANFLTYLNTTMAENEIHLNLARQERHNQRQNQVLREQQEQAFQESLEQDREKQRQKEEKVRREREQQENEKMEHDLLQEMRHNLTQVKDTVRQSLPTEPLINVANGDDASTVIRVSVKFPNGARYERRFYVSDSLEALFNFTMCQKDCPESFSIFNVFPRQILLSANLLQKNVHDIQPDFQYPSFHDAGLHRSATLIVQDNDA